MNDQSEIVLTSMPQPGYWVAGQYKLVSEIGRGTMGVVWKARDCVGERIVCIKFLPVDRVDCPQDAARLKASFRSVHQLQHENLCPHHAFGVDRLLGPFVVMKYFKGPSLADLCVDALGHRRKFSVEGVLRLLSPIADGLDYLHSHGLVHRDIKPANILPGSRRHESQIVDFGLVERHRSGRESIQLVTSAIAGSGAYLAPEIWQGHHASPMSDQYSLATIIYEMLAGRRPFEHARSATQLMKCALNEAVPVIDGLHDELNHALQRALAKQPDDRFRSNRALMQAIRDAASGKNTTALLLSDIDETIILGVSNDGRIYADPSNTHR